MSAPAFAAERFDCLIEPNVSAQIGTHEQGIIAVVEARRGDRMKAGDVLARLDAELQGVQLEQARLRAAQRSEIEAREADLELAKLDLERAESLHAERVVPAQERDRAVATHRLAKAALAQAKASHALLQLELEKARRQLERRIVRSPFDGVVVDQHAFPGEFVSDQPVLTIAQTDPLRVEVVLPAARFGEFAVGDPAVVLPEIAWQDSAAAIIDQVDAILDAKSGTFGISLLLPNPDGRITSGQECTALLHGIAAARPPARRGAESAP